MKIFHTICGILTKNFENFLWNFWKKLKFYIANISQKSCVFKWIFKKMILKIFYVVIFLKIALKSRLREYSRIKYFNFNWFWSIFMCIFWFYVSCSKYLQKVLALSLDQCAVQIIFNFESQNCRYFVLRPFSAKILL